MHFLKRVLIPIFDVVLALPALAGGLLMRAIRILGLHRMPLTRRTLLGVGVYPLRNHYYDPLFDFRRIQPGAVRELPGLDLNTEGQLKLLREFHFNDELLALPMDQRREHEFYYGNGWFGSGDAEMLYNMVRRFRPARVIEVGCGYTTLLFEEALRRNAKDDPAYRYEHWCVEPYENPWLERLNVTLIRAKIEDVTAGRLPALARNDILFVDTSHIIRAGGDVLHEVQQLIPSVAPGVIVHFHDIFTPREYPMRVWTDGYLFFGEQYLLESFLTMNPQYRVLAAVNQLAHDHTDALAAACPIFSRERAWREPGSFWFTRV